MNPRLTILALCLTSLVGAAQVPAIPEPPVILNGTATDGATNLPVTISSIVWEVSNGKTTRTCNAALGSQVA